LGEGHVRVQSTDVGRLAWGDDTSGCVVGGKTPPLGGFGAILSYNGGPHGATPVKKYAAVRPKTGVGRPPRLKPLGPVAQSTAREEGQPATAGSKPWAGGNNCSAGDSVPFA